MLISLSLLFTRHFFMSLCTFIMFRSTLFIFSDPFFCSCNCRFFTHTIIYCHEKYIILSKFSTEFSSALRPKPFKEVYEIVQAKARRIS